jgi:hypothetical protein
MLMREYDANGAGDDGRKILKHLLRVAMEMKEEKLKGGKRGGSREI